LGNLYGSNIFNGLLIVAIVALITPIAVTWHEIAVGLGFGLLTTVLTWPVHGHLWRAHGIILLIVYVGYLVVVLQR
jgi:Ca2+/Na+ antiporter